MSGRNSVSYVKPPEPNFLKRIKEKVGYKEGPTIETKKEVLSLDEEDGEREERDDEKPVVVALEDGDFNQEEADFIFEKIQQDEKDKAEKGKKIRFTKPTKRSNPEDSSVSSSSKKTKKPVRKPSTESETKQVKNKSLLSFDDEEDDDD